MPKRSTHRGPGAPPLEASVADLRALAHPLRLRIMELFAEMPRTTKQVAELLNQPPTRLYHHVAALERAGLLELRETRKNRGATEKWYATPAKRIGTSSPAGTKRRREDARALRAAALTILEQSKQEAVSALEKQTDPPPLVARLIVVAPQSVVIEVRDRLRQIVAELQRDYEVQDADGTRAADTDRWAMTMTFAPVATPDAALT